MKSQSIASSLAAIAVCLSSAFVLADESSEQEKNSKSEEKSVSKTVSISVNTSKTKDGDSDDVKTNVTGRIVIVGPDGERKEYDLTKPLPKDIHGIEISELLNDKLKMVLEDVEHEVAEEPRYMIGVMCESASELLRRHLKLGEVGLVVTNVSEEMPATNAGINKGDILLRVSDTPLKTVEDLVRAVTDSEGAELALDVVQNGKRTSLSLTPKKSTNKDAIKGLGHIFDTAVTLDGDFGVDGLAEKIKDARKNARQLIIRRIGPGFQIQGDHEVNVEELIKKQIGGGDGNEEIIIEKRVDDSGKELHEEIQRLRKRLGAMEKQLKKLQKESKSE